jgi:hypothetical protein
MSPFFANFGREPRLTVGGEDYLPTAAVQLTKDLGSLHEQLRSDIQFLNHRMALQANATRIEGPILKEGDKSTCGAETSRLNAKAANWISETWTFSDQSNQRTS